MRSLTWTLIAGSLMTQPVITRSGISGFGMAGSWVAGSWISWVTTTIVYRSVTTASVISETLHYEAVLPRVVCYMPVPAMAGTRSLQSLLIIVWAKILPIPSETAILPLIL